jgi:hypothetical protein
MKLWLDDIRDPPDATWMCVRTPEEAIAELENGLVTDLSLDHDLGLHELGGRERSGYDVLVWIETQVADDHEFAVPELRIHSANPVGRARMEQAIESIRRLRGVSPSSLREGLSE